MFGGRLYILNRGFWYSRCDRCDRIDDKRGGGKVIGFLSLCWKVSFFYKESRRGQEACGFWEALYCLRGHLWGRDSWREEIVVLMRCCLYISFTLGCVRGCSANIFSKVLYSFK